MTAAHSHNDTRWPMTPVRLIDALANEFLGHGLFEISAYLHSRSESYSRFVHTIVLVDAQVCVSLLLAIPHGMMCFVRGSEVHRYDAMTVVAEELLHPMSCIYIAYLVGFVSGAVVHPIA
ncbi:hypothetical protein PENSPDRAFT_691095 [Peniophora sp. CONT]|nr:hypothetical protein PENSPDRAFT_691095 [Peniophora sp. CONT]